MLYEKLKFRISVAAHDRINFLMVFTEWTVMTAVGSIIRDILLLENGMYRHICYFVDRTENGSNSTDFSLPSTKQAVDNPSLSIPLEQRTVTETNPESAG